MPGYTPDWSPSTMAKKPKGCEFCPMHKKGAGFVGDEFPEEARVLFVFAAPRPDDAVAQRPLGGAMGKWYARALIYELGHKRSEVAITHILRCAPKTGKYGLEYPTGSTKTDAEKRCRQYDGLQSYEGVTKAGGVLAWRPEIFMLTFSPDQVKNGPALVHLLKADVRRAFQLADKGYRVALLFGPEPGGLFMPHVFQVGAGGIRSWRGHFKLTQWGEMKLEEEQKGFKKASSWRRYN